MYAPPLAVPTTAAVRQQRTVAGPLLFLLLASIAVGIAHRLLVGWMTPLWLDETFTGVIATQPDSASLMEWCLVELSGPVYYVTIWLWEKIAGPGDIALRAPSLVFSI